MGFLLKEALKTLCGRNQWSYAVFWKIGCGNSKLLIWEECYYEPMPCPLPLRIVGTHNLPYQSSQLEIQEEDRVCSLINKMIVNNSVNVAGEGMIGRAAFTGNHQWFLLNNFARDAYPLEVYAEMHHQFSAGMQTVAVIPVLPHGVVQLGSFLPIIENMGFVNDVKSLILQLGCVPGALLSEDCSAKLSNERLAGPLIAGMPLSVDPSVVNSNCTPSVSNGTNQHNNSSFTSRPIVQPPCTLMGEINNFQGSALTPQTCNMNQIPKYHDNLCQPKSTPMITTSFAGKQENRVVDADKVPPLNLNSCLRQHSVSDNARSAFSDLAGRAQSDPVDCSLKYIEQIMSATGSQDHANASNINAASTLNMSQLKADRGPLLDQSKSSGSTSLLEGMPLPGRMSRLLMTNLVSKFPEASIADFSGMPEISIGVQNDYLTKAGCSLANLTNQSGSVHMHLEGSDQKNLLVDLKHTSDVFLSTDKRIGGELLQALKIPSHHPEEHVSMSDHIPGTNQSMMQLNVKQEEVCAQHPSGDDLFDVLGVDFKNKLLNGNWNNLLDDESGAGAEHLHKKEICMDIQGTNSDCYSVNEAISDSGIFSGRGTDHLLDAVVSRAQSISKQNSDDISCGTTLTGISTSSVPSPSYRQIKSDNFQGGLFDLPKTGSKTGTAEISSLRSGCRKDEAKSCSQTTSIYGSQPSSWVENVSRVKLENSISTGYSKRPDEACKSNRKRLKPGENPRPRPKDRQMIQDRVKELREIVPNGAKCSIDALLERTIKHMLFLQGVTKHADKLKQTGESKIISNDGRQLIKDNFDGGATWAYEVGSQSMVCPIIVEDLNAPRQMLVEMLCEERGFFLEIADLIRGLGLTILKGVMEAHNEKIWARFAVEANRDVTRMEIFMSLVRLLDQTVKGSASSSNAIDNSMMVRHLFPQATEIPATGRPSG